MHPRPAAPTPAPHAGEIAYDILCAACRYPAEGRSPGRCPECGGSGTARVVRRSAYDLRCERVLWGVLAAHALLIIAVVVVARFGARLLSA